MAVRAATANFSLIFRQLFDRESCTYTYLLGCPKTREAVIIDPVLELVDRDIKFIKELDLKLIYGMNTHVHADHITSTNLLREQTGCKTLIAEASQADSDVKVNEGDKVQFGERFLTVRATPGHTNGCVTYVADDEKMAFVGDALLIRGCGRTDFQQGCSNTLYKSVHNKIFSLPAETVLYPGHDYDGRTATTVAEEKEFNPRLTKTEEEFVTLMENLNLPLPNKIDEAVPANMKCGVF
mmetsp:Transcript_49227/g.126990  ORF Transcript_49227/g.126990 Transcript_49227/m.126990 type:complete len:239 (-) Transcript_49227:233-949(-)|eukprot:CAMPEP_0113887870 /NCGR_PEP_ID=MMETSP0780_2-20120614/12493_1 /TAXON_ID=652834 /ORGANISM="Palpitomonas bilix" /LENGTH=238 /DNA_ID=CAMNT_0000876529 /DNA_START=50 /DNA_END=766 /DNA_ORIENTATION=+ /assembly_acc=CAM_ASM_000599